MTPPDSWFEALKRLFAATTPEEFRKERRAIRAWLRAHPDHPNALAESVASLDDLGHQAWKAQERATADHYWSRAYRLAQCGPAKSENRAILANNLAMARADTNPADCERLIVQAHRWYRRYAPDDAMVAMTCRNLGSIRFRQGKIAQGVALIEEAYRTGVRRGAPPKQVADSLRTLGIVYAQSGKRREALNAYREAEARFLALDPEGTDLGELWGNISTLLLDIGDLTGAEGYLNRCVERFERTRPGTKEHGWALATLARIYEKRNDLERAAQRLREALTLEQRFHPDSLAVARTQVWLSAVLRRMDRFAESRQALEHALEIERRHGVNSQGLSEAMGNLLLSEERYAEALPYYEQALEFRMRRGTDPLDRARVRNNLAECHHHLGAFETAIRIRRLAWRVYGARAGYSGESFRAARGYVRSLLAVRRRKAALQVLEEALGRAGEAMGLLRSETDRLSLLASVGDLADLYVRHAPDDAARFRMLDRTRGRLVRVAIRERQPGHRIPVGTEMIEAGA